MQAGPDGMFHVCFKKKKTDWMPDLNIEIYGHVPWQFSLVRILNPFRCTLRLKFINTIVFMVADDIEI